MTSKNLYNDALNEYVDWLTGQNELTQENDTKGLASSGKAIRRLLEDRLRTPFVVSEDKDKGLYLLFASEYTRSVYMQAKNAGDEDEPEYQKLILFSFNRPDDISLNIVNMNKDTRYIKDGQTVSLSFGWEFKKGTNDAGQFPVAVKYTITTEAGEVSQFTEYKGSDVSTVKDRDLTQYMATGKNVVKIQIKSTDESVSASAMTTLTVIKMTLSMVSTFAYNTIYEELAYMNVPYTLTRNLTGEETVVFFYIDGVQVMTETIPKTSTAMTVSGTPRVKNVVKTLDTHQHTLQVVARTTVDNQTFYSNLVYFTYVVQPAGSDNSLQDRYVNVKYTLDTTVIPDPDVPVRMSATQFEPFRLSWGYTTFQGSTSQSVNVTWKMLQGDRTLDPETYTETVLGSATVNNGNSGADLMFIPSMYTDDTTLPIYLEAYISRAAGATLTATGIRYRLDIAKTKLTIAEAPYWGLKLDAYGRSNSSGDASVWEDADNKVTTTFSNISWDDNNGWYDGSFRTMGTGSWAEVQYAPLGLTTAGDATSGPLMTGRTIEVEFESEHVSDDSDVIIRFGDTGGGHIDITPNSAGLYIGTAATPVVKTNFKANEHIKLAFIIHAATDSQDPYGKGLVYIVNNGVLERAAPCQDGIPNKTGLITIGKSASGVRVYSMRIYPRAITYTDEFNNFVYDSSDKGTLYQGNDIMKDGEINYQLAQTKLDTFLIEGDLSAILTAAADKDASTTNANISRKCPTDSRYDFTATNIQIRKHGQSTLNYPITSMKFWTNKSFNDEAHSFICSAQSDIGYGKSRYMMMDGNMPANKYILQANYADSSCAQNGALERLFHTVWYNAVIDGQYRLRTDPQLFATNKVINYKDATVNEDGRTAGLNAAGKQWGSYVTTDFPHEMRISPNALPAVVFYKNTKETGTPTTFLGQFVLMDDKKSDFTYGERSIYNVPKDPFCLLTVNAGKDTDDNMLWDNDRVVRVEVVQANTVFSSYMTDTVTDTVNDKPVVHGFTDVIMDRNGNPDHFRWEEDFELIYPDPDDLTGDATKGTDKYATGYKTDEVTGQTEKDIFGNPVWASKFRRKAEYFIRFYEWLVSARTDYLSTGTYDKFRKEAAGHLDLYKLAAYYNTYHRFGLVDNVERNAQLKTYDGVHWHYEPWDMDIGIGKQNNGNIAYQPPMDRETMDPDGIVTAFSGRSFDENGKVKTSNWLWDALEAWPEWKDVIVPKVADAMWTAGLKYDEIIKMFDGQFTDRWCETFYNESGHFKYIEAPSGSATATASTVWLPWLQGSGKTYRHWWLSQSMSYYDAKWNCGDFKNHNIYISANYTGKDGDAIRITANTKTFFSFVRTDTNTVVGTLGPVDKGVSTPFSMANRTLSTKVPFSIYGATCIDTLDLSDLSRGLTVLNVSGSYNAALGAPLKNLYLGVKRTLSGDGNTYTADHISTSKITVDYYSTDGHDALANLQTFDIAGIQSFTSFGAFAGGSTGDVDGLYRSNLKNVYAEGSGLKDFYSSATGNKYETLRLPDTVATLNLYSSSWNDMSFWHTSKGVLRTLYYDLTKITDDTPAMTDTDTGVPVYEWVSATDSAEIQSGTSTVKYSQGQTIAYADYTKLGIISSETGGVLNREWVKANISSVAEHTEYSQSRFTRYAVKSGVKTYYSSDGVIQTTETAIPAVTYIARTPMTLADKSTVYNFGSVIALKDYTELGLMASGAFIGLDKMDREKFCQHMDRSGGTPDYTLSVPPDLMTVYFKGNTGMTQAAKKFIVSWIDCINADPEAYGTIGSHTLQMDRCWWGSAAAPDEGLSYEYLSYLAAFNEGDNSVKNLAGYVMLTDTANLTTEQMLQINAWFGASAFIKGSTGAQLVIDQKNEYINISLAGGSISGNELPGVKTPIKGINAAGEIEVYEGSAGISIFATQFLLQDVTPAYTWTVRSPEDDTAGLYSKGAQINAPTDEDAAYTLDIKEWSQDADTDGESYTLILHCTSNQYDASQTIRVIPRTYPGKFTFKDTFNNSAAAIRSSDSTCVFYMDNLTDNISLTPDKAGTTATVDNVYWTLTDPVEGADILTSTSYKDLATGVKTSEQLIYPSKSVFQGMTLTRNATDKGILLNASDIQTLYGTSYKMVTLSVKVIYKSNREYNYTRDIILIYDTDPIVTSASDIMYMILSYKITGGQWSVENHPQLYKSDLIPLTGRLDMTRGNAAAAKLTADSGTTHTFNILMSDKGDSIFRYLPNVTEVDMHGCPNIVSVYTKYGKQVRQLDFTQMAALETLNLTDCPKLTETVDLSKNVNLTEADAAGTTVIDVTLPEQAAKLATVKYGSPSTVAIVKPAVLTAGGVTVVSGAKLKSVRLEDVNTGGTPGAFGILEKLLA